MTMTAAQSALTILTVVAATMLTRFLPFLIFPEGRTPPAVVTYLGKVLPCAVIGLLVVYRLARPARGDRHPLHRRAAPVEKEHPAQHRRGHCPVHVPGPGRICINKA